MITVIELARRALELCKRKNWSLHWTARGCYLHLESSELIEAVRGKGKDPTVKEAGDVLIVLMSITENEGIPFTDVMEAAEAKIKSLMPKEHEQRCKNCLRSMNDGDPEICQDCKNRIENATVRCSKCGKVPGEFPMQKYCGDGRDKDNEHDWKKIEPKVSGEVDPPPSSIVDQKRISQILGSSMTPAPAMAMMFQQSLAASTRVALIPFPDWANPKFADRCHYDGAPRGTIFELTDATRIHSSYQVGNPVSPAPKGAVGCIKKGDQWFWVCENEWPQS